MVTRSKGGIFKPKTYSATLDTEEPSTHYQAMENENWKSVMSDEYNGLIRNKTRDLVPLPKNKNVVGCK